MSRHVDRFWHMDVQTPAASQGQPAVSHSRSGLLSMSLRHPGRLLAFAVAILMLFAVSEYFQAPWLRSLNERYPPFSQVVQGAASALICALLLVWVLSSASPSPLPGESSAEDWLQGIRPDEQQSLRTFAKWFIAVRWVAVAVAAILALLATRVAGILPAAVAAPLATCIAGLAASNVAYRLLLPRYGGTDRFLRLQVFGDLAFFAALLHFSGGVENPLSLLMVLHVIIGGTALGHRHAYAVAAVAMLLLGILGWAELNHWLEHRSLVVFPHFHVESGTVHAAHMGFYVAGIVALHGAIFFVTAFFVSTLASRVRYDERQLAAVAARAMAERRLLEHALETTGTGLRVSDTGLQPYWCNAEWLRLFPADYPADPLVAETLTTREVRVAERTWPPTGTPPREMRGSGMRILQLVTAPLLGPDGEVSRIVELFQDITLQKETQAQAIRAGKLAAVGELAGQVAHEVNNPITIISAKARLLLQYQSPSLSAEVVRELGKIVEHADRVARIAQGLLSYCRPSTGARSRLTLEGTVRKALGIVEPRARGCQVRLEDELPDSLPPVLGNDGELQQVFLNLFLNALDAMPRGGVLCVSGRCSNGTVEVRVTDTGNGIPPEVRGRVFEPFVTTKEDGRGTGLGLSICLGLVRSHGGEITYESESGRGTSFTVKLPAAAERQECARWPDPDC